MIYTERIITVINSASRIDTPIILYRGDREIKLILKIVNSKFKFESEDSISNAQLVDINMMHMYLF